ncbi:MAG TPA: polysaccharide deacetylase family protein [Rudaea sp.]
MRIPILAYHSANIAGNDYANNDHVAFAHDLALIAELGLRIVPAHWIVDQMLGRCARDLSRSVVLTCDDAPALDYYDLSHPQYGQQKGLINLLREFDGRHAPGSHPHLTCFAIASPQARARMDEQCLAGQGWMTDEWWSASNGHFSIENHSWDHNHPCLGDTPVLPRGDFHCVDNADRAEYEIAQAQDFFAAKLGASPSLFCYPYSHVNDYLSREWLPTRGAQIGLEAAFGDGCRPAEETSDRWNLPRYICGWHWKSADELRALLNDAAGEPHGNR